MKRRAEKKRGVGKMKERGRMVEHPFGTLKSKKRSSSVFDEGVG